jgi:heptosyltransferase III
VRIVIFRPGALGDTLLALPALALLRASMPLARVTLVARADVLPLARASGLADAVYDFDLPCWSALWREHAPLRPPAADVLRAADAAVAWAADDGTVARNLAACGIQRVIVAPGNPPAPAAGDPGANAPTHVALHLARTLAPLLPEPTPRALRELPGLVHEMARAEDAAGAVALLAELGLPAGRIVTLHPGSGGAAKGWPAAGFADVARRLLTAGFAPLLLAGPADGAAIAATRDALGADAARVPVARDLALPALVGVLRRSSAYLGNDSGVSHLAALCGTPTLALFGPTDPAVWTPLGPRVHVLRAPLTAGAATPAISSLSFERVWTALAALLGGGETVARPLG